MALETKIKKPKDLTKINANDIAELLWWSHHFSTSPEKLLTIIEEYGNSSNQVRQHITRHPIFLVHK